MFSDEAIFILKWNGISKKKAINGQNEPVEGGINKHPQRSDG